MEANTFGLRVQQLSQSMRSISCTLFLLAIYPGLGQLQRQDCSSPTSLVCDSSIVKPALEKSSVVTTAPGKQHRRHRPQIPNNRRRIQRTSKPLQPRLLNHLQAPARTHRTAPRRHIIEDRHDIQVVRGKPPRGLLLQPGTRVSEARATRVRSTHSKTSGRAENPRTRLHFPPDRVGAPTSGLHRRPSRAPTL